MLFRNRRSDRKARVDALNEIVEGHCLATSLSNLIQDLEKRNLVDRSQSVLEPYEWDGMTVKIQHKKYRLLLETIKRDAFRATRLLVVDNDIKRSELSAALLKLCGKPTSVPDIHLDLAHLLLNHGASPNVRDSEGRTALQICIEAQAPLDFVSLIATKSKLDLTNGQGNAVLHEAIKSNNVEIFRVLLYTGANPDLLDGQGRLPLVLAAHLPMDTCLQILLRHGAQVNALDSHGRTALSMIENPAAAMVLLQKGARSDTQDADGIAPLHTAFGLWCRWRRGHSLSQLMFNQQSLADLLVAQASSINLHDNHGRNVLHYVCEEHYAPAPDFVRVLVDKGAKLDKCDQNGWTPLHVAVAFGNYATAATLIELGADIHTRDCQGRTPLHVLGMDHLASLNPLPHIQECDAIQIAAFGTKAAPFRFVAPLSDASILEDSRNSSSSSLFNDNQTTPLVNMFLHRGFDFRRPDKTGNLPFFFATDDSMHYTMLHSAACQGLFG